MKSRGPYRRHSTPIKLQLCQDIRNGVLGWRDAKRTYGVSANLMQLWLTQFDRGDLNDEEAEASVIAEYEATLRRLNAKSASSPWSWGVHAESDRGRHGLIVGSLERPNQARPHSHWTARLNVAGPRSTIPALCQPGRQSGRLADFRLSGRSWWLPMSNSSRRVPEPTRGGRLASVRPREGR